MLSHEEYCAEIDALMRKIRQALGLPQDPNVDAPWVPLPPEQLNAIVEALSETLGAVIKSMPDDAARKVAIACAQDCLREAAFRVH
jgi:hypothetical protein